MSALLQSKRWPYRALRIALLVAVGWWVVKSAGPMVRAGVPIDSEWPNTDFSRALVNLDEITSGGPPKDGIPAIDEPRFVDVASVGEWLDPREPVIVVSAGGNARAYPLQILIYHEIVNDVFDVTPIAVTFCPLCNASIVFRRQVQEQVLDFGTTGRLRKSDLVMYDRQTESWWQQFTGRAIVGEHAGTVLRQYPSVVVAFETFREAYPAGMVLSRKTGYRRPYGRNPYRGYDRVGDQPFAFRDALDPRLPAMERVLAVSVGARPRLYPFSVLAKQPVINDRVGDSPIAVFSRNGTLSVLDEESISASRTVPSATAFDRRLDGRPLHFETREGAIVDVETGSRWNVLGQATAGPLAGRALAPVEGGVHFAFAWLAFRPDSSIFGKPTLPPVQ